MGEQSTDAPGSGRRKAVSPHSSAIGRLQPCTKDAMNLPPSDPTLGF